ncbi:MAG: UbiA family prenyltransferase [candidate division Zixibacteria bacterium]|nr:UbiA family prenyltransferase [candidate division Zixibacteria bacterium]
MGYIQALRLPVCLLAGMLTLCGFQLAVGSIQGAWLPALVVVVIASSTMVWNDYRDREHDRKKGKDFACLNRWRFLAFGLTLWFVSIALSLAIGVFESWTMACLALGITASGLVYSETRLVPFVPNALVALTAASPVLFPLAAGHHDFRLLLFYLAVTLAIHAREIAKDFDDVDIDPGYKWTLLQRVGQRRSLVIIEALLFCVIPLLPPPNQMASAFVLMMMILALATCENGGELKCAKTTKWAIDIATMLIIMGVFGSPLP